MPYVYHPLQQKDYPNIVSHYSRETEQAKKVARLNGNVIQMFSIYSLKYSSYIL